MRIKRWLAVLIGCALALAGCAVRTSRGEQTDRALRADPVQKTEEISSSEAPPFSDPAEQEETPAQPPFLLAAYLPASAPPQALEEYTPSLALLGRITVITGLCWEEDDSVRILDERYGPLLEALRSLYDGEIYATIYPERTLIREGRAGASVDTPEKRAALADAILAHAEEYALDGVDIDWETPIDDAEWALCSETLCALGKALSAEGKGLSAALYPEHTGRLTPPARNALQTLNLMTYDQFDENGHHSTFTMMEEAVRQVLREGYAPEQILPGIPAYGRPLDRSPSWPLYRDAGLPADEEILNGAAYNCTETVTQKTSFAREAAGGVFFFHLLGDLPADSPLSLLHAAEAAA